MTCTCPTCPTCQVHPLFAHLGAGGCQNIGWCQYVQLFRPYPDLLPKPDDAVERSVTSVYGYLMPFHVNHHPNLGRLEHNNKVNSPTDPGCMRMNTSRIQNPDFWPNTLPYRLQKNHGYKTALFGKVRCYRMALWLL